MLAVNKPEATVLQDVVLNALRFATSHDVIQTPIVSGAIVDGVFCKNRIITGVFEIKCWRNTESNISRFALGKWFTDKAKFDALQSLSKSMCVPSYLIAHVELQDVIYVFNVCDRLGVFQFCFVQKEIKMNSTTFGDSAVLVSREIVEFDISLAKIYKIT